MVSRNLFGTDVNIQIGEGFPSDEEIKQQDNLLSECEHGWIDSTYEDAKLHYRYWLPKGDIKGVVVYFHGINTQSGKALVLNGRRLCTSLLSDTLVGNGLALFSLDLYGHGFSEGTRFWVPSWETNRDDCVKFVKMVSEKHSKDIPLFVAGESYGGCLSVHVGRYFQDHPGSRPANFDSLLLAAPSITADLPPFPTFQFLKYILAPLFPKWTPFFMPHPVNVSNKSASLLFLFLFQILLTPSYFFSIARSNLEGRTSPQLLYIRGLFEKRSRWWW
jgi:pimeloyl-ACP methyl ester carboxylesterase